jgi:pimeloyl-ACP methyl ester carboxylesterase
VVVATAVVAASCTRSVAQANRGFSRTACAAEFNGLPDRVECGTMTVAVNPDADNGRTVSFPVVIVRAPAGAAQLDPVIYLHGGPGGDVVSGLARQLRSGALPITSDRDWIFFDERGTGLSVPLLDCGQLPLSDAGVTSDDGAERLQACGRNLAGKGIDLSQYNSATIVKDIRALRQELRITSYTLFGISYGTRVAMAVMQHDPEGLRAAVLDSLWPPEANATGPLPRLVSREVRQILRLCAADQACGRRYPQLERRLDERLTRWLTAPLEDGGRVYTAGEVAAWLLDALYDTDGARSLPASLDALLAGDSRSLAKFLVAQSDYVEGQFFTHMCKEEFPFERPQAIDAGDNDPIAEAAARNTRRFFPVCEGFKVGVSDPVENQPLVSAIPTLILTADIDAGCPAELAETAVTRLSNGAHYNFVNRTHGVTRQSACARSMAAQFLATTDPHVDARCMGADQPMFNFVLP